MSRKTLIMQNLGIFDYHRHRKKHAEFFDNFPFTKELLSSFF